jgi:hypothetical protein
LTAGEDNPSLPPEQNPVTLALNKIGTVHFARFAFLGNDQLGVITTYDGDFAVYINEFIDTIGDVFNALIAHVEKWPLAAGPDSSPRVSGLRPQGRRW